MPESEATDGALVTAGRVTTVVVLVDSVRAAVDVSLGSRWQAELFTMPLRELIIFPCGSA